MSHLVTILLFSLQQVEDATPHVTFFEKYIAQNNQIKHPKYKAHFVAYSFIVTYFKGFAKKSGFGDS